MTAVKICGITNPGDAYAACDCGADALGFVFFEPSPRCVKPAEARKIIRRLPASPAKVGVFVNPEISLVQNLREFCGLDFIQLSGDESPDFCRRIPGSMLLKVISGPREEGSGNWNLYRARAFVVDSREPGLFGGTGRLSDWELARAIGKRQPVILAGGLTPENVGAAIAAASPAAVDVSSGVEISPGGKDRHKMKRFMEEVRAAGGRGGAGLFDREGRLPSGGGKLAERIKDEK